MRQKKLHLHQSSPDSESNGDLLQSTSRHIIQDRQVHIMCDQVIECLGSEFNLYGKDCGVKGSVNPRFNTAIRLLDLELEPGIF
jgi:hypothetical protein